MTDIMRLFLEPTSVAVIGVPRATGPDAYNIVENMLDAGFSGTIYPINPRAGEILGIKAYSSILDIDGEIDLAVIMIARAEVPRVVWECVRKDVKAITIVTQGFADADDEGKRLQAEVLQIARRNGTRIVGPNSWGTANPFRNFTSGFTPLVLQKHPIGLIAQTGFYAGQSQMAGKFLDLGNTCDIGFSEGLEYFENDPETKIVFLHIEGIKNGREFVKAASRLSKKKPIIALKVGRGEQGAKAAISHTGNLAGRDEIYEAAFRQCGIIRVSEICEFPDLAKALLNLPLIRGPRVGVITSTGGAGMMTIDILEKHGLRLAQLSSAALDRMSAIAPPWQSLGNPADMWAASMIEGHPLNEVVFTALDSMLQDDNVDAVMLLFPAFIVAGGNESRLLDICM